MTRVSDAIKQDHRELEDYYNQIINATDHDTQIRYRNQFTWELARHSIGEELVVYPAFEQHVENGKAIADKDRKEHQPMSFTLFISSVFPLKRIELKQKADRMGFTDKRAAEEVSEHGTNRVHLLANDQSSDG